MKRTKQSQKRTKFLLLLLVLTAILSITATYAWFSTQRDVEITGMRLNVEVAESMQISLDGEKWLQSIEIEDMRQLYGTYTGNTTAHQAKAITATNLTNHNYVPTELLAVSTAGELENGKLKFVTGVLTGGTLGTITACDEDGTAGNTDIYAAGSSTKLSTMEAANESHPYLVFDMYLRNISAKATGDYDDLFLNNGSAVWVESGTADDGQQEGKGVANTGLEYSARVGFIVYSNTVDVNSTSTTLGEDIRGLTTNSATDQLAIWEPNHLHHTQYVVSNNGRGITSQTNQTVDTYGILSSAVSKTVTVDDTSDTTLVKKVHTYQTAYSTGETGVTGTDVSNPDTATGKIETVYKGDTNDATRDYLGIQAGKISKVRVYVWLEGQDPDCIDLASTGDKLNVNIKLIKATNNVTANSYAGGTPS